MTCLHYEPKLSDALSDPVVLAMMAADGVTPQIMCSIMRDAVRKVDPRMPIHIGAIGTPAS